MIEEQAKSARLSVHCSSTSMRSSRSTQRLQYQEQSSDPHTNEMHIDVITDHRKLSATFPGQFTLELLVISAVVDPWCRSATFGNNTKSWKVRYRPPDPDPDLNYSLLRSSALPESWYSSFPEIRSAQVCEAESYSPYIPLHWKTGQHPRLVKFVIRAWQNFKLDISWAKSEP
jgi:hypothetical protein